MPGSRVSPSLIVSVIALVVATAGTGIAATTLISRPGQVGKNVIRGKHVKNGTLSAADLSAKSRAALKGNAGVAGSTGPAGPAGPTGPAGANGTNGIDGATGAQGERGPSNAYERSANNVTISSTVIFNPPSVMTTQSLPAGSYAVSASLQISNSQAGVASVVCSVTGGGTTAASGWTTAPGEDFVGAQQFAITQMAMTGTITLAAAGPLSLNCARDADGAAVSGLSARVVAVRVADLSRQTS